MMDLQSHGFDANIPLDVDTTLFEVSSRMARAQIARQISRNSSIHRQHKSRITKVHNTSSSPQDVQHGRSRSADRKALYRASMSSHGPQILRTASVSQSNQQYNPRPSARPITWHPSTGFMQNVNPNIYSTSQPQTSNVPESYQVFSTYGLPTPMIDAQSGGESPDEQWLCSDYSPAVDQGLPAYYGLIGDEFHFETSAGLNSCWMPQNDYTIPVPLFGRYSNFPSNINSAQDWNELTLVHPEHTAPPTPEVLPTQKPGGVWPLSAAVQPDHSESDGVELVGLGLYDQPEQSSHLYQGVLYQDVHAFGVSNMAASRKSLKLEDAWQPPVEEVDDDEEDGDDDEDREMDGDDGGIERQLSNVMLEQPAKSGKSSSVDLSDRSFLFDDNQLDEDSVYQSLIGTVGMHPYGTVSVGCGWI